MWVSHLFFMRLANSFQLPYSLLLIAEYSQVLDLFLLFGVPLALVRQTERIILMCAVDERNGFAKDNETMQNSCVAQSVS